ncbi:MULTISPECIES: 5'-nucleotidase, lipoprotein e(P4) family [Terrabacteria group]|uniref:5'-nucleotidase, lipoprotein e(P4) family n=1 Tax=Bacillati TaxID=1783272 RepID=UPI001C6DFCFB|nr:MULTISPECIES: 5'-nucleotidase, lipoprotein e(P4) family [Terrabacteria group]MBW9212173.1 5'-nucleotidase, lipoprotein e(P4) family [Trueperella sp. zg.1013]
MFKKKSILILSALLLLTACSTPAKKATEAPKQPVATQEKKDGVKLPAQGMMAVAWYQTSAEAKALYTQGYNAAIKSLEEKIKNNKSNKKLAVVLDLDETVLDNSPIQAHYAVNGKAYPEGWHEWVMYGKADVVYGAKEFLDFANKNGVGIFYVTDRNAETEFEATKKNLIEKKLPLQSDANLMLKAKGEKGKDARRKKVEETHKIVMLVGDNLHDFATPKDGSLQGRDNFVKENAKEWGDKFIMLPNPMYGSWEGTLYNNDFKKSDEEKDKLRKSALKIFNIEKKTVEEYK